MLLDKLYAFTMDVRVPITSTLLYVIYSVRTNRSLKNTTSPPRNFVSLLTFIMIIHNIILCLFSLVTFIKTFPIVLDFYMTNSLVEFMRDSNGILQSKLKFWIWLFYVSKKYEIIDSLILHWNKKPTSFLQMYHHAGAIVCCWLLVSANSHLPWIFVVLNSFIHTLMYFYYLLVTVRIGVSTKVKRIITRLQIVQFVSGVGILIMHVLVGGVFSTNSGMRNLQFTAIFANVFYVAILFMLFRRFEKKTYQTKTVKKE